jgi:hypothetical protein
VQMQVSHFYCLWILLLAICLHLWKFWLTVCTFFVVFLLWSSILCIEYNI